MFKEARIKLTVYYLTVIMVISVFFSFIIYEGAAVELQRIEVAQRLRRPSSLDYMIEPEIIEETKFRIIAALVLVNSVILVAAGVGGYFLAGKTLAPIKKNMDEQKEFISDASHELRTPITSLKTEIEVGLRDKRITLGSARELLISNLEEVNKMQKLTDNLLKLSRFEGKLRNLELKRVDLKKIALRAIGKKRVLSNLQKSVVNGNEDALVELVTILIDNAFKYSSKGLGVSVIVKNKTIAVSDKGVGISDKDLPHIFDRFYRSVVSRTKDGYGLGLSIAKQIAELHGAKIEVISKLGVGSTFKVIFS